MHKIEQILVPVDFSSFSRSALAFARQLGNSPEKMGKRAHLQLAHAVEAMPPYIRSVLFPYAALGEDDRRFEAEIVESVRAELRHYFEIDDELAERFVDEPAVEFGFGKEWIERWAGQFDVEMIVVGAFGKQGVFTGGPGSTSRRVAATASKPVALVRDYDPVPTIARILAAVDLGTDTKEVLDVAVGLAADLGAELEIMHVIASPFVDDARGLVKRCVAVDEAEIEEQVRPSLTALMQEFVDEIEIPFSAQTGDGAPIEKQLMRYGEPAREIAEEVQQGEFDLVVIGRGRDGLGRTASAVMADVPRHLVVVPGDSSKSLLSG